MFPDAIISLLLVEISEPAANQLRLVLLEMSPQGTPANAIEDIPGIPILPTPHRQAIEVMWDNYVLYSVLNESYATYRKDLPKPTSNLYIVDDPVIDEFIAKQTWADHNFPGPFKHWKLHSENHVVLVTSCDEPQLSLIDVDPTWLNRDGPELFQRARDQ